MRPSNALPCFKTLRCSHQRWLCLLLVVMILATATSVLAARTGGTVVLTRANPTGQGSGTFVAPGRDKQDYTLFDLDCRDFTRGGTLVIQASVGSGASAASFDLFPAGVAIPSSGPPVGSVSGAYDIAPGGSAEITYKFESGTSFRFGATGNWYSEAGATNTVAFTVTVKDFPPDPGATPGGGGRTIVPTRNNPRGGSSGTIVAPGDGKQSRNVFYIDMRDFTKGAFITIKILLGQGACDGSFDVFPEGVTIPTEGPPVGTLGGAYDVKSGTDAKIDIQIDRPQVFQFNATGNWYSPQGATNTFTFTVEVTP